MRNAIAKQPVVAPVHSTAQREREVEREREREREREIERERERSRHTNSKQPPPQKKSQAPNEHTRTRTRTRTSTRTRTRTRTSTRTSTNLLNDEEGTDNDLKWARPCKVHAGDKCVKTQHICGDEVDGLPRREVGNGAGAEGKQLLVHEANKPDAKVPAKPHREEVEKVVHNSLEHRQGNQANGQAHSVAVSKIVVVSFLPDPRHEQPQQDRLRNIRSAFSQRQNPGHCHLIRVCTHTRAKQARLAAATTTTVLVARILAAGG